MAQPITIFRAHKIRTMNAYQPVATHVAVKDGRILGVGTLEDLAGWGTMSLTTALQTRCCCRVLSRLIVMP